MQALLAAVMLAVPAQARVRDLRTSGAAPVTISEDEEHVLTIRVRRQEP